MRAVEYLFDKYAGHLERLEKHDRPFIPKKPVTQRKFVSREEHDRILKLYRAGVSRRELQVRFGRSESAIFAITSGTHRFSSHETTEQAARSA